MAKHHRWYATKSEPIVKDGTGEKDKAADAGIWFGLGLAVPMFVFIVWRVCEIYLG